MFTLISCTPLWSGLYKSGRANCVAPLHSAARQLITKCLKMGVYDGVYQLDMSQADPNWAAMHKEMGGIDMKNSN